jgi:hypothetical protein
MRQIAKPSTLPILALALILLVAPLAVQPASASPTARNVTLYAHYDSQVGTVNSIATGGLILNPKQTWSASTQEVSGALDPGVTAKWYQYPVLAGDLTIRRNRGGLR